MNRKFSFSLVFSCLLFICGCGAALTGAGILLLGSSKSSSFSNGAPQVTISNLSASQEVNDLVRIEYKIFDPESHLVNLSIEWKTANGNWNPASMLVGTVAGETSDSTTGLSSSPTGKDHLFIWNSFPQLPAQNVDITLRIIPTDSLGFQGPPVTIELKLQNEYSSTLLGKIQEGSEKLPYSPRYLVYADLVNKLFISNEKTNIITSVDLNSSVPDTILTQEVGNQKTAYNGDHQNSLITNINQPLKMAFGVDRDSQNRALIFCDSLNHRVRMYNLATRVVTTIAGDGSVGFNEFGRIFSFPADNAMFFPFGLSIDRSGSNIIKGICISELGNKVVRYINLDNSPITFFSGVKPIEFGGSISNAVKVLPNEMRTILGNPLLPFNLADSGPVWASDIHNVTFDTSQVAVLMGPKTIQYFPRSGNRPPVLFVVDHDDFDGFSSIRVLNMGVTGEYIPFYTNDSFNYFTVEAGYVGTIFGRFPSTTLDNITTQTIFANNANAILADMTVEYKNGLYHFYFIDENTKAIYHFNSLDGNITHIGGAIQTSQSTNGNIGANITAMAQQGANGPGGQDAKKVALVFPSGLEKKGNALVLSDQGNNKIQAINLSTDQDISILGLTIQPGKLETLVTGPSFLPTEPSNPKAIVQDPDDANIFYIADSFSNRILKLEVDQRNVSVIAGNGLSRSEENKNGDGGEAINAVIGNPTSLAIWKDNNTKFLLVADNGSFKTVGGRQKTVGHVRIINLGTNDLSIGSVNGLQQNRIDTLIGGGGNSTFDLSGADPRTIQLEKITSVAVDTPESGKLPCIYVATYSSNLQQARILAFNPNGTGYDYDFTINGSNVQVQAGTVSTIAMEGGAGFLNNFQNNFQNPKSLGTFSSFGQISFLGGARPASSSQELVLFLPLADENLILAINYYSLAINLFGFILNSGEGTRICGRLATSGFFFPDNYGYNGDFISPKSALLANPTGVQYIAPTTASNNREMLLIADTDNGRIRAILGRGFPSSSKNLIVTFAGSGITGFNGDTLPSNDTHLSNPQGFWLYFMQVDSIYKPLLAICDSSNSRIRRVVPSFLVK